ncbi:MAG: hypothetical protein A2Y03_10340 [Omnitrophica WOR_2 bacterium GWF2_38_59]|nr:MAG: hypothetical protein A2Y03_10340 [Omnitrophica WOR_2 bacterium GWF2_38_59]OGX46782.1 MAG: hypothetical protein A2243_07380 [Omnitrophica WOR_2 bacterium RIFOXYA2_FULL_38_17]OGX59247.1 MAG: hypothetical protein A2447_06125 [Omnitrophica WOR_2 bacterium RIFOXYC2_FULL_38_12]OGX59256.1 MAG: hypothetical protein A2306_03225 [Omnitrophica WOR_2 bacterium RIFOXYB2_FULL_38_16]HBG61158.1 ABC transporter substrate-binding protein [Candidatus Omnitrophota bacterium]
MRLISKYTIPVLIIVFLFGCQKKEVRKNESITILWAQWAPSDYLQELSKDFTKETGIKVIVKQEPWTSFQDVFFKEMAVKGESYDMVAGDSQWLGRGSVEGHYVDISKWMIENKVDKTMTPASVVGYSEYPKDSGRYWAVPLEGDAMGFAYRKDLFEDINEKKAFQLKYGYPLAIPKTWSQLKDISEFFYRPDEDFYGVAVWCEGNYDGVTMGVETFVWAWGADLGDYKKYKVQGILNSTESVEALKAYKQIYQYSSPDWKNAYLDTNKALIEGKVSMIMSYFAFFPGLLDPEQNPYAHDTGFFANPSGPKTRVSSLGGQGLSVISYSKKKDLCFKFIEWLVREDVQMKWAELGGYSCNNKVLSSEWFLRLKPYNRALMESMNFVKDFWVVPEYSELLKVSQEYWFRFLTTDEITSQEAMDAIAQEWENIFEWAGYYKE